MAQENDEVQKLIWRFPNSSYVYVQTVREM